MLICLPQLIFPSSFTVQVICRRQFYSLRFQKLLIPYLEYCFYLLGTRKLFGPGWLVIPNTSRNLVIPSLIKRVEKWEHKPLSWEQMSFCTDIRHDACYNVSSKRNIYIFICHTGFRNCKLPLLYKYTGTYFWLIVLNFRFVQYK